MLRVRGISLAHCLGEVKSKHDRLVDPTDDIFRTLRDGEQLVFRQVELERLEDNIGYDVDGEEQSERQAEAGHRALAFCEAL
jgi:hypothetical protein